MLRSTRIVAAGYPIYAIPCGIDRAAILYSEADDRAFLAALVVLDATASVRVHAYVLMANHVHLLATSATDRGPARLMKGLGQRYVQYMNRTYHRTGTLF